ncbi:hypothetical protein [Sphingopyxis macrogoltabida]|uniref:Uncharacterized protein n=1 Tax=Sphingopyxis macrogoltabida TaxID=33050 RepID=A0A0N7GT97_SPHMC|nr:hypothetical protein [Sphingopyxis macrogoltabida]ALH82907.1 hypothetical protein AN936_21880 [Sphingopyxis macrogoltabida]
MTSVALCNQAMIELAAPSIASLNEPSAEARACAAVAFVIMEELVDWTEWHWTETYQALAQVPNDRPAEWLFAYAQPFDCVTPLAIRGVEPAATALPLGGPSTFPRQAAVPLAFTMANGKIYTNVETATLVYNRKANFQLPALVSRAYVIELAARTCYAIKKDAKRENTLIQKAAFAKAEAISDERNKVPRQSPRYISDAEYARAGIMEEF